MSTSVIVLLLALYSIIHGVIVLLIVFGGLLATVGVLRRWPSLERVYLMVVGGTILSFVFTRSCFLTEWEQALRWKYLPTTGYNRGFISHYLTWLGLDLNDWHVLYFLVTVISLGLAGTIFHHWRHRRLTRTWQQSDHLVQ